MLGDHVARRAVVAAEDYVVDHWDEGELLDEGAVEAVAREIAGLPGEFDDVPQGRHPALVRFIAKSIMYAMNRFSDMRRPSRIKPRTPARASAPAPMPLGAFKARRAAAKAGRVPAERAGDVDAAIKARFALWGGIPAINMDAVVGEIAMETGAKPGVIRRRIRELSESASGPQQFVFAGASDDFENILKMAQDAARRTGARMPPMHELDHGFGWIEVPKSSPFGRWLKQHQLGAPSSRGREVPIDIRSYAHDGDAGYSHYNAGLRAAEAVFDAHGIESHVTVMLD